MVSAIGVNPCGTTMKCLHVILGVAWIITALQLSQRKGRRVALCCSVATLWYLPVGTAVSILTIILIMRQSFAPQKDA